MRNIGIEYPAAGTIAFKNLGTPPELKPTEILIETLYSGITNGTERHALMGEHFWKGAFPSAHGYQHVGRIVQAGADVTRFAVGDVVFFGHYLGHRGWNVVDVGRPLDAAYEGHLTIKLPDTVDHAHCALLGVAGVAMRGARRFRIGPASKVWVAGQGMIGQFAAQSARALGAHVTVTDINDRRLAAATECGAHVAINANAPDYWERIKAGAPYDCIIDCAGVPSFLMDLFAHHPLIRQRSVIGLFAVRTDTTFNWGMLHIPEASIEVSCHFSVDDLRALLHFIEHRVMHVGPLVTHRERIDDAIGVYERMRDRPGDLLGVIFDWR